MSRDGRDQEFIQEARNGAKMVLDGINILKGLQPEWNYRDYANTLDDGTNENSGITRAEVGPAIFDSADAIITVLGNGHGTNLAKLI